MWRCLYTERPPVQGKKNSVSKHSISIKAINFPAKNTSYPQTHYHYPKK